MKKIVYLLLTVLVFSLPCLAGPKADPGETVFTFAAVPEGEKVVHGFVVKNWGDATLNIINVLPP